MESAIFDIHPDQGRKTECKDNDKWTIKHKNSYNLVGTLLLEYDSY
jgi:hypothetical protein